MLIVCFISFLRCQYLQIKKLGKIMINIILLVVHGYSLEKLEIGKVVPVSPLRFKQIGISQNNSKMGKCKRCDSCKLSHELLWQSRQFNAEKFDHCQQNWSWSILLKLRLKCVCQEQALRLPQPRRMWQHYCRCHTLCKPDSPITKGEDGPCKKHS